MRNSVISSAMTGAVRAVVARMAAISFFMMSSFTFEGLVRRVPRRGGWFQTAASAARMASCACRSSVSIEVEVLASENPSLAP